MPLKCRKFPTWVGVKQRIRETTTAKRYAPPGILAGDKAYPAADTLLPDNGRIQQKRSRETAFDHEETVETTPCPNGAPSYPPLAIRSETT
jgi:hypothetical protein